MNYAELNFVELSDLAAAGDREAYIEIVRRREARFAEAGV